LEGKLGSKQARHPFAKIEKETMLEAIEMEKQLSTKVKESSKSTIHSLGGRLNRIKMIRRKRMRLLIWPNMFTTNLGQHLNRGPWKFEGVRYFLNVKIFIDCIFIRTHVLHRCSQM